MGQGVRPRILIAGSYRGQVLSLAEYLKELSAQIDVIQAIDGREALTLSKSQQIHLFLVDGFLKGSLNGFDLCRALRSSGDAYRHTPIILILSGHLIPEHARGISAGADLLLHAPVVKEELWRMVVLLLGAASQSKKRQASATQEEIIELTPPNRVLH
jgi:CheY-like chemotaxis protein